MRWESGHSREVNCITIGDVVGIVVHKDSAAKAVVNPEVAGQVFVSRLRRCDVPGPLAIDSDL